MYRMLVIASFSAIAATACSTAQVGQVQPIDGVISGQCHNDMVRGAVGLAAAPGTVERARVDSDSLQVQVVRGSGDNTSSATPTPAATSVRISPRFVAMRKKTTRCRLL